MDLCTDLVFTDPVLQRVFFDGRCLAPKSGHDAIVHMAEYEISRLKVLLQKARDLDFAEDLQAQIRRQYFLARRHCDGYLITMPAGHDDGCEHVMMFEHGGNRDPFFATDYRRRAELRHRFGDRTTVHPRRRSARTRTV